MVSRGWTPLRVALAILLLAPLAAVWLGPCGWLRRDPGPTLAARAMPLPEHVRILQAQDTSQGVAIVIRPYAREPERLELARGMAAEFLGEAAADCTPVWLDLLDVGPRGIEVPSGESMVRVATKIGIVPELSPTPEVRRGEAQPGPGNALWALYRSSRGGVVPEGHTRSVLVFLPRQASTGRIEVQLQGRWIPLQPREVEWAGLASYVEQPGPESFQALARGEVAAGSS